MGSLRKHCFLLGLVSALLFCVVVGLAGAQSVPPFADQNSSRLFSPSNPLGAPGNAYGVVRSECIPLSS
jgi:hypothetical protein